MSPSVDYTRGIFTRGVSLMRFVVAGLLVTSLCSGCGTLIATSGQVSVSDHPAVDRSAAPADVGIGPRDRATIEKYYAGKKPVTRGAGLPAGVVKYDRLPSGITTEPLPTDLERQLSALPLGLARVRVGVDVV